MRLQRWCMMMELESKWKVASEMFNLPAPGPFLLERPPLAAAVAQVRFPLLADLQELAGIAPFQKAVRHRYPFMEQVHQQQFSVVVGPLGPTAPATADRAIAWKFTANDSWTLSLEAGAATLSVGTSYTDVEEFRVRWRDVLEALINTTEGALRCDRLSIRYVDAVDVGEASRTEWRNWFRPELVGWLASDILDVGAAARIYISQSHVVGRTSVSDVHETAPLQGLIRHGLVPVDTAVAFEPLSPPLKLNGPTFLVDVDLFIEVHQPFDSKVLMTQFSELQGQAAAFFWWSLTDAGKEHFGAVQR